MTVTTCKPLKPPNSWGHPTRDKAGNPAQNRITVKDDVAFRVVLTKF
jgi:hypothetical protein